MAAFANLSLLDGQAVPVAHAFNVQSFSVDKQGRLFYDWLDVSVNGGIPIGANRARMWITPLRNTGKRAGDSQLVIEGVLDVPVMEVLGNNSVSGINPQPQLAYPTSFWFKTIRNGRATAQPSKDAVAFARDFVNKTVFTDALFTLSNPT